METATCSYYINPCVCVPPYRLDGELCVAHLVRLFSVAVSCLASHNTTVTHTSSTTIQVMALPSKVVKMADYFSAC